MEHLSEQEDELKAIVLDPDPVTGVRRSKVKVRLKAELKHLLEELAEVFQASAQEGLLSHPPLRSTCCHCIKFTLS